jgi:hypothetical protein
LLGKEDKIFEPWNLVDVFHCAAVVDFFNFEDLTIVPGGFLSVPYGDIDLELPQCSVQLAFRVQQGVESRDRL